MGADRSHTATVSVASGEMLDAWIRFRLSVAVTWMWLFVVAMPLQRRAVAVRRGENRSTVPEGEPGGEFGRCLRSVYGPKTAGADP